jgi:hypothetical protein
MPTPAHRRVSKDHTARWALGCVGLGLSVASLACIGLGLPWQTRFPVVITALLLGPGVPLILLRSQLSAARGVVAGIGVDVALVMLVAEGMVLGHVWWPRFAICVLLMLSVAASVSLLRMLSNSHGGPKCAA